MSGIVKRIGPKGYAIGSRTGHPSAGSVPAFPKVNFMEQTEGDSPLQLKPNRLLLHVLLTCVRGFGAEEIVLQPPTSSVHHILLEAADLKASISFYRDLLGLHLKSQSGEFVTVESRVGEHWSPFLEQTLGLGSPTRKRGAAIVSRARQAGYKIVQDPRRYDWGTEAFIADTDGYIWALVSFQKKPREIY